MKTTKGSQGGSRSKHTTSEVTRAERRSDQRRAAPAVPSPSSAPSSQTGEGTRSSHKRVAARAIDPAGPRIEHDGVLARGGMGAVHRVFDHHIRRYAAMKVLDEELASQPHARRRFLAEAQIAGQLDHPNIVPVYDLDLADGGTPRQFTMKLVDGVTLTSLLDPERVAKRSVDELRELLDAFVKVCDAVAFAHSRGVVHRDLKPENVMLGAFGQVYVMDWGIARVLGEPPSSDHAPKRAPARVSIATDQDPYAEEEPGTILGTTPYMAPEQAWGNIDAIDARTDVFALGGILYQILTGHAPYEGESGSAILQEARHARVRPPSEIAPGLAISPSLERIALKALARAPEHRYPNASAMKHDVETALRAGLSLGSKVFRACEVILREGEEGDAAYIITSGIAVAFKKVETGKPSLSGARADASPGASDEDQLALRGASDEDQLALRGALDENQLALRGALDENQLALREMGPGEVFGEMALLASRPRSASVVAKTDVTAIVVTKEALARELHAESWLAALVRTLVDRLCDLDARVHVSSPPKDPREK